MPRTVEKTIYKFNELSDAAKEQAREWYRSCQDSTDLEHILEDAAEIAGILGIDLRQRPVKLMNGSTRYDPAIYYSGFWSQGDGACFEGRYAYKKGAAKAIRDHAPQDTKLHRIARELQDVQRRHFYRLEAKMAHRGHYYHSGCMSVDVTDSETGNDAAENAAETITQLMRDFADWIYDQLRKENDYINADEQVDENIIFNDYDFDEHGRRTV